MQRLFLSTVATLLILLTLQGAANAQALRYSVSRQSREDPAVNIYLSARYDRLLQTNLRFRHYRMWKECHTVTWPGLHESCIASFDLYEPFLYS
jgi:hypothetical protein